MERAKALTTNTISLSQAFAALLALMQAILLYWVFDQTARLRGVEVRFSQLESKIEATQPFVDANRATLGAVATTVSKQDVTLEQTVGLVRDINTIVQTLAKQQVEFRVSLDRIEQQILGHQKGK